MKDFKKQRTDKKREFKNEFKEKVAVKAKEINSTQKGENKKGVAVVKLWKHLYILCFFVYNKNIPFFIKLKKKFNNNIKKIVIFEFTN